MGESQDAILIGILAGLEEQNLLIKHQQSDTASTLDKRALAIAVTHLETAQLWLANSRPD